MFNYVAVGDFDEDGNPDLVMAAQGHSDAVELWLGNGDGSLRAHQPHPDAFTARVYVGDVDRDGHLDVVTSNGYDAQPGARVGYLTMARMARELTAILGRRVDLRTPAELHRSFRDAVLSEAVTEYVAA